MTCQRSLRLLIVIGTIGGSACGGPSTGPSPVPAGAWGGDHVAMTVADAATHLELDCAHGDIPGTITVDARGQFDVAGVFVREHGGLIKLESHLGQGTTFRIWLPLHERQPRLLEARWHD